LTTRFDNQISLHLYAEGPSNEGHYLPARRISSICKVWKFRVPENALTETNVKQVNHSYNKVEPWDRNELTAVTDTP